MAGATETGDDAGAAGSFEIAESRGNELRFPDKLDADIAALNFPHICRPVQGQCNLERLTDMLVALDEDLTFADLVDATHWNAAEMQRFQDRTGDNAVLLQIAFAGKAIGLDSDKTRYVLSLPDSDAACVSGQVVKLDRCGVLRGNPENGSPFA